MKSFRSPCGVFFDQSLIQKSLNDLIVSQQRPLRNRQLPLSVIAELVFMSSRPEDSHLRALPTKAAPPIAELKARLA